MRRILLCISCLVFFLLCGCASADNDEVVLRVCNWEEYIDLGDWDEDEAIELDDDNVIIGTDPMYEEFCDWYYEQNGVRVRVEYSCFGTNEDIYNQLTIGDTFDLICPSDYMIMKLMKEGALEPYSDEFFDSENELNYYIKGVSPYIRRIFDENQINGESWSKYSAGYMWGTTGIVYNPQEVSAEDASHWNILLDEDYRRKVTIKDNVRDSYFAAMAILKEDILLEDDFVLSDEYETRLAEEMNDTSDEAIDSVCAILKDIKGNAYSFETDSAKADMAAGKVDVSYQWSGDAVYTMEVAGEEGVELSYIVPEECGNLWFDGWVMLKKGIEEDARKKAAAEAFVNYLSRPDNAVRNMYYIGYTSVISGGEDSTMFDYADWYYGSEDEEDTVDYDITYFFSDTAEPGTYVITSYEGCETGGLGAQYPTLDTIRRCAVMQDFSGDSYEKINRMWIDVRCFNILEYLKNILVTIHSQPHAQSSRLRASVPPLAGLRLLMWVG